MEIMNLFFGIAFFILGVLFLINTNKIRAKGNKGGYGGHINLYYGAIGSIFLGLVMILRELF